MSRLGFTLLLIVLVWLAACGGGSYGGGGSHKIVVTISPRPTAVRAGTTVPFSVTIQYGPPGLGVNWTLSGPGTFTNVMPTSVNYNAPPGIPVNPAVTITATSQADPTATDSVTFGIN